jgi:hypothetical protein
MLLRNKRKRASENIMVVGGHLDSWDWLMVLMMTEQEWCKMEVLNIFKT